ncbi:MAG: 30S ribosomal protein S8 [bacterium]
MINDHISDMISRIKNAYAMHKKTVSMPYTKVLETVAKVMLEEKYLAGVKVEGDKLTEKQLVLTLAYKADTAAISSIKRISKPGVRIYRQVDNFKPVLSGLGIAILSTSKGVMSDRNAKIAKIGGEVLLELW